jgi:hypothetical protein
MMIGKELKSESWFSLKRREMLGSLLVAAGTLMAGCKLTSLGTRAKYKGNILLSHIPKPPRGLVEAVRFPLIEAIHGRRARRFSLGSSTEGGSLAFQSRHEPMPLNELEQMMVLTAVAGNTGWQYLIPYNPKYLPHIPNYAGTAGGRTFPSAAGFHTSEFFYTDDNGVYFLPTRDAPSLVGHNGENAVDLNTYLKLHQSRILKLADSRLSIPSKLSHIEGHNPWCVNRPGSTLIIPVADLAHHHIAALCYLVQNGTCIYDDINKNSIPGIERFRSLIDADNPYPLTSTEQLTLTEATAEISTACYAGMLMLQAMGLGGWLFDGIAPISVLGASGDPEMPGLGFRYDTDARWPLPNVTGLPGVFEGLCPPHYPDMRAAVEAFVKRKFEPGGPFHPDTPGPYRDNPKIRGSAKAHSEEFKDCVATMAQYVFNRFGKFPGTIPTMFVLTYLQAHHLDLEFYNKYFNPGAYLETHAHHMELWHAGK